MRKAWMMGTGLLATAFVLTAFTQQSTGQSTASQFATGFTGVNPRNIKTVSAVNPNNAMKGTNLTNALQPNATQRSTSAFNLGNVFRPVTLGTWPPKLPSSFSVVQTPKTPTTMTVPNSAINMFVTPK
jgi:hypothetical protein